MLVSCVQVLGVMGRGQFRKQDDHSISSTSRTSSSTGAKSAFDPRRTSAGFRQITGRRTPTSAVTVAVRGVGQGRKERRCQQKSTSTIPRNLGLPWGSTARKGERIPVCRGNAVGRRRRQCYRRGRIRRSD